MLERLTASLAGGGMMLAGLPLALEYVVRPGDTLSQIAHRHDTTVERLVERNDLDQTGDRIVAGETLTIPAAHDRQPRQAGSQRAGSHEPGAERRRIVGYTVRPGDTPSGLAVRFHAWTDEIIERNGAVLRAGERIVIPVVPEAGARRTPAPDEKTAGKTAGRVGPSREAVRRVVAATARRHGVDPALALAVSWQEAGWQMHPVSGAGAIGAMQVMPSTGRWMEGVVGRPLDLRDLHDNATAGVALLAVLLEEAPPRQAVAGYYQGLTGVRRHGMYDDTRRYVANVLALRTRIAAGDHPG